MKVGLLFCLFLLPLETFAQGPALSFDTCFFQPQSSVPLEPDEKALFETTFKGVLKIVAANASHEHDNLFYWAGDRKTLQGKSLRFLLANSTDEDIDQRLSKLGTSENFVGELDSFTEVIPSSTGRYLIESVFLIDRIFLDAHGENREDAGGRLVAAVAGQVLGNVQMYLEIDLAKELTPQQKRYAEIQSHQEALGLMSRLLTILSPAVDDSARTAAKFRLQLDRAILREGQWLATVDQMNLLRPKSEN